MKKIIMFLIFLGIATFGGWQLLKSEKKPQSISKTLIVYTASSFAYVLNETKDLIEKETGVPIVISEAASSTLARQIETGAPVDIFVTADLSWLQYLQQKDLVEAEPVEIAINRLVYAAPKGQDFLHLEIGPFVTGDPAYVPLGKYAKEALIALGTWQQLEPDLISGVSARDALRILEARAALFGILYRTDVLSSEHVYIVEEIPENLHSPIIYWVVSLKDSNGDATENFINFLKSETFRTILRDKGFAVNYN